jgi:glycosyltransferase involved in cell wall biosynthesis
MKLNIIVCGMKGFRTPHGGMTVTTEEIHSRLVSRGHIVTVFEREKKRSERWKHKGMTVYSIPFINSKYGCYLTYMMWAFIRIIPRQKRGAIVHLHLPPINGVWVPLFRLAGFRVICHTHGLEWKARKWPKWFKWIIKLSHRVALLTAHAFVCVSEKEKFYFEKQAQKKRIPIIHLPNAPPVQLCKSSQSILAEFGCKRDQYFLVVGRIVPQKGIVKAIRAFAQCNTHKELIIVGTGSFSKEYESKLRSLADTVPRVRLLGWLPREKVYALYSGCFAFIQPSTHEGCPHVLLEAIAHGAVCIVSDILPHREIAPEGLAFFPADDPTKLSAVMRRLEYSEKYYLHQKCETKKLKEKLQSWDSIVDKLESLYHICSDGKLREDNQKTH